MSDDFSHHPKHHGFCRQERVIPHHVFLNEDKSMLKFRRLATNVQSNRVCNEYCCQIKDCSLAFTIRGKCYGVLCPDDGECETRNEKRLPLHAEIAFLKRRGKDVITVGFILLDSSGLKVREKENDDKTKVRGYVLMVE